MFTHLANHPAPKRESVILFDIGEATHPGRTISPESAAGPQVDPGPSRTAIVCARKQLSFNQTTNDVPSGDVDLLN